MPKKDLKEQFYEEIDAIMTVQKEIHEPDSEQYHENQKAVDKYLEMINKIQESERLDDELKIKVYEINKQFETERRKDYINIVKIAGSFIVVSGLVNKIVKFEDENIITSKAFNPVANLFVKFLSV